MLNLGINDSSINYEVALEVLGQSRQPFMQAIADEKHKHAPSQAFVSYCESRLNAIDKLQRDLRTDDRATIERILTNGESLFNVK